MVVGVVAANVVGTISQQDEDLEGRRIIVGSTLGEWRAGGQNTPAPGKALWDHRIAASGHRIDRRGDRCFDVGERKDWSRRAIVVGAVSWRKHGCPKILQTISLPSNESSRNEHVIEIVVGVARLWRRWSIAGAGLIGCKIRHE